MVLTGAGVSVASGIWPYRGPGGLWNDATLARLADIDTFLDEPLEVWRHWWKLRELARAARTVYLNLQGLDALGGSGDFDEEILGPAEILAPRFFAPARALSGNDPRAGGSTRRGAGS